MWNDNELLKYLVLFQLQNELKNQAAKPEPQPVPEQQRQKRWPERRRFWHRRLTATVPVLEKAETLNAGS